MERLWSRFQQLGPNEEGTLPSEAIQHASFVSDPLVKQVIIYTANDMIKQTSNYIAAKTCLQKVL